MEGERSVAFEVRGHSGYAQAGEDIVCAAVSSAVNLVTATVNEMSLLQFARSFAPDVVLLEPEFLAKKVKETAERTVEAYKDI